jgi:hypothetical protein
MSAGAVEKEIERKAGNPDLTETQKLGAEGQELSERKRSDVVVAIDRLQHRFSDLKGGKDVSFV